MTHAKFHATPEELATIKKITDRLATLRKEKYTDDQHWRMNLIACNTNGTPMDFDKLLHAPDFDFIHDLYGIEKHLDKETGKLTGYFLPRCAKPKEAQE